MPLIREGIAYINPGGNSYSPRYEFISAYQKRSNAWSAFNMNHDAEGFAHIKYKERTVKVPTGLFIANEFVPSVSHGSLDIVNPLDQAIIARMASAGSADVDEAVHAAERALEAGWRDSTAGYRGALLGRLADLIEAHAEDFALIEAVDAGIPYQESLDIHLSNAVSTLRYYGRVADQLVGDLLDIPDGFAYTRHEPFGVCAAIVPWNSPVMITSWKIGPAIATGNTLIIKTPELAPLYGQLLGRLIVEAGFPPGVISILCGLGYEAGQAIAEHMRIRKLSFTGSSQTGIAVQRAAANSNLKVVTLELGGKGAALIFPEADLRRAAFWTNIGSGSNNGQICSLVSRIYVHEQIYDEFITLFRQIHAQRPFKSGDPADPEITKGPIISRPQFDKIWSYIDSAVESGAKPLFGGQRKHGEVSVPHTAFVDVNEDMPIVKEEIFGPVVTIAKFATEAEAVAKANDTEYGLASWVFTSDIGRAKRVSEALQAGTVMVNRWGIIHPHVPFGGVKQSGFGRELGREGLHAWMTVKSIIHWMGTP